MTQGDKYWADAQFQREGGLEAYVADEDVCIDWDVLRKEAENEELSMQQQFKIVSLLCTYEYQCLLEDDDTEFSSHQRLVREDELKMFRKKYPDSSPYANAYLKKVNTAADEFWKAFEVTFGSCDFLEALVAAADELDGQTVFNLTEGLNEDEMWGMKLKAALMKWIQVHPEAMEDYIEGLIEKGYCENWGIYQWQRVFLYNEYVPYGINTATIDDALSYISGVREILIPQLGAEFDGKYQSVFGREMPIQWVFSKTPVDLYEAKTGRFLGRIGVLLEAPPDSMDIWADEEKEYICYPELVSADVLSYVYHNINEPEKYADLMYSIPKRDEWQ